MSIVDRIKEEPVLTHALFIAILNVVVSFGLELSGDQIAAMNALVLAGLSFVVRAQVTPLADPHSASGAPLVEG